MATYARIDGGLVMELFTPPTSVPITECFAPGLVWVECDGTPGVAQGWTAAQNGSTWTFTAPAAPPPPTVQQQALALLNSPITVQCAGVPAIDGNYPIDSQATQTQITGIAAAINAGFGLPGGGSTFNWPDTTGAPHAWPAAQFTEFAKAVMNFVYTASQVAQGHSTTLPSATLTIA